MKTVKRPFTDSTNLFISIPAAFITAFIDVIRYSLEVKLVFPKKKTKKKLSD